VLNEANSWGNREEPTPSGVNIIWKKGDEFKIQTRIPLSGEQADIGRVKGVEDVYHSPGFRLHASGTSDKRRDILSRVWACWQRCKRYRDIATCGYPVHIMSKMSGQCSEMQV